MGLVHRLMIVAATSAFAAAAPAAAVTINFNTASGDNLAALTIGAVTFTAPGATLYTTSFGNTPNGTRGLVGYDSGSTNFFPIRADVTGGTTTVSIDLGDNGEDADSLFLRLYDSGNVLLATATDFIPGSFAGLKTLTASAPGVAYAVYGGVGVQGSSVYTDNFTYSVTAGVPEAATWTMMIAGVGLAGTALRRRRTLAIA